MKKIMFNDHFGLTEAVLSGRKTMTRRLIRCPKKFRVVEDVMLEFRRRIDQDFYYDCVVCDADARELGQLPLPYEIGDVVAVTQRYEACWDYYQKQWEARNDPSDWHTPDAMLGDSVQETKGWKNKMFVRADLMPHHVRIADLWFECLQDISEEDCLKEGIIRTESPLDHGWNYQIPNTKEFFLTPRGAFARLIDLVSHDHVWDCNPWAVAYTLELVD